MRFKIVLLGLLINMPLIGQGQVHDYTKAQHLSTRFLGAQRSGDTKSWILPEGSGGAFVNDGEAVERDLSGGWHDCGDYIKFHVTGPYTALMYLYGYYMWPEIYPDNYSPDYSKAPGNGIPDVLDEVKIQTDYLMKCIDEDVIYWQIGDNRDHSSFKEPISHSEEELYDGSSTRSVYEASEGRSNAFGSAAAALALMSMMYEPFDSDYSQKCLEAAKKYYEVGNTNPAVTADAREGHENYIWLEEVSDYQDEMGMGAAMIYRATGKSSYLDEAIEFSTQVSKHKEFNYGHIHDLLFYELYRITDDDDYLDLVYNQVSNYTLEECGYFHLSDWGSLRDAGNAAFLSALYHYATGDEDAYSFAKSNIDFILGSHDGISEDAPANFSFLIGYNELGGGYPQRPHHAAAFGKSENVWDLFNQEKENPGSVEFEYELTGALAGGPESPCAGYEDNIGNYQSNEYCTYYNAAFTGAVAYINKIENGAANNDNTQGNINNQNIKIYSNPSSNFLKVTLAGTTNLALIDMAGELILDQKIHLSGAIDTSEISQGLYILKSTDSNWNKKIVIK